MLAFGGSGDIAATLRTISDNPTGARLSIVLYAVAGVATLVLATMLYTVDIISMLVLLSLGPAPTSSQLELGAVAADVAAWSTDVGATFFAVGSTLFAALLLRGRSAPVPLAALGVVASLMLVAGVPLETANGRITAQGLSIIMWLPMFAFEISTGIWLLVRGPRTPVTT